MSSRLLITALVSLAISALAWAQAESTNHTPPPAAAVAGSAPTESTVSRDKDTLSVDFPDEDVKTILRNVADLFELNLVVPDTLTGRASIKLRDVTWRQIFKVVLSPVGYSYIEEGNIIKIVSNESLLQEPTTTEVIILNNAKAGDIMPTITVLIDAAAGGKIVVDARSNALVITERPSRMGRIRDTITKLDKATEQVMIETKFVEVTDRDVRNIGVNWASLQGVQLGAKGISQTWNRDRGQDFSNGVNSTGGTTSSNNTSTNGSNQTSNQSSALTNNNTSTTTTSPSTTTTTVTNTVSGFSPTSSTSVSTSSLSPTTNTTNSTTSSTNVSSQLSTLGSTLVSNASQSAVNTLMDLTNTGSTGRLASAVFSASDFNVILSALKTQNNTKIVSNPTVVTLNNTEAFLNIGQEFPIPNYTYNTERGTFEVSGFTYKPIGIIMKVTPQVNGQGIIKLTVEPEVSQRNGETSFGGAGGATIPIIATRKAKTQVSLQNGFTMGIGGLITSTKTHGGTKVPVLGDIPGLGKLFSSRSVNDEITNLLIFLTAKTVSAEGASPEEVFDPRAVEAIGMTKEDLPGYRGPARK